jgi:hypothetical protein
MGQLQMTGLQVAAALEDMLAPNYAREFKVIADTSEMVLLEATAGNAEDNEDERLEYKVNRRVDYIEGEEAYFMVMYRTHTGWTDATNGDWRWSTHIAEAIPNIDMLLMDVLAYEGLQLNQDAVVAAGIPWLNERVTVYGVCDWLHGKVVPDFANTISYSSLLDIHGAVEDIPE